MDHEKFIADFENECKKQGTNYLTDLSKISYLTGSTNILFKCNNGHEYRGTIKQLSCVKCDNKIEQENEKIVRRINNSNVHAKFMSGMKLTSYDISEGCKESYPCKHFVTLYLEDDSSGSFLMTDGRNILDDKIFVHKKEINDNKSKTNFKLDCIKYNTNIITDLDKIIKLTYGTEIDYKCNNGHEYKSTVSNPQCEECWNNKFMVGM